MDERRCRARVRRMCEGIGRLASERAAQGTLEYALTVVAFLAMVVGVAALWRAAADGVFAELVRAAASHAFSAAGAIDISLY